MANWELFAAYILSHISRAQSSSGINIFEGLHRCRLVKRTTMRVRADILVICSELTMPRWNPGTGGTWRWSTDVAVRAYFPFYIRV